MEHSHQDVGRRSRVGKRPQDVEQGAHPEFFANRRHVFHGGMVVGRKHKANAYLGNALGNDAWREVDVNAQAFQHIGAAAFAADAATAVLADPRTRSSSYKHGAGGDVEGVGPVSACAHDVHQMCAIGHLHLGGKLPHHLRSSGDLANGFLLHPQAGQDGSGHERRDFALHDHAHQVQHFVVKNLTVLDGALQSFAGGDGGHGCRVFKKLFNKAWPCSVRMDSGWNCTPWMGRLRWRTPMISPSSVQAVTSNSAGQLLRSMASEW